MMELAEEAIGTEAARTEKVWRQYHGELQEFIRTRVGPEAAEDVVQEVFLRVHTRLGTVRDEAKLRGWVYQIARNAIADHWRARRDTEPLPQTLVAVEQDPVGRARREMGACAEQLVERLPDAYREAVVLSDLEGIPQREVAARQGLSTSGAKSRVQRGRAMVKEMLTECCDVEYDRRGMVVGYEATSGCCAGL